MVLGGSLVKVVFVGVKIVKGLGFCNMLIKLVVVIVVIKVENCLLDIVILIMLGMDLIELVS